MMQKIIFYGLVASSIFLLTDCVGPKAPEQKKAKEGNVLMVNKKTDSGLAYEVIKEGSGELPHIGQRVTVHYTGWLDNNGKLGTKFDSSVDRGEPFSFILGIGQVIQGWDEGVKLMKVGEKRRLIIPSKLGYGSQGAGAVIPPNTTLIFDVELLKIS